MQGTPATTLVGACARWLAGEEEDEEEERGGGGEPAPKKARTVPEPKAPEPKVAAKPRRRGVVLSDDEDD